VIHSILQLTDARGLGKRGMSIRFQFQSRLALILHKTLHSVDDAVLLEFADLITLSESNDVFIGALILLSTKGPTAQTHRVRTSHDQRDPNCPQSRPGYR
jgi:hypothetical protein